MENKNFEIIFNAIAALAEKLTGERLVLTVWDENGNFKKIFGGISAEWEKVITPN